MEHTTESEFTVRPIFIDHFSVSRLTLISSSFGTYDQSPLLKTFIV